MRTRLLVEAQARLRAGDIGAAVVLLDGLLEQRVAGRVRSEALKLRSRAREAQGDLGAAIADLEAAMAAAPGDAHACNALGILHSDAGATTRALECFARAVEIDPAFARGWNNLGNARRAQGDVAGAEHAFARATAVDPNYALAFANLGALRRERGDYAGADAALARALALEPGRRSARIALAGLRRQRGAIDAAAALYAEAAAADPRDAEARLLLAQTVAERDELATAQDAYDAALARDPALLRALLGRHLTLPMIPPSRAAVDAARATYLAGLTFLEQALPAHAARLSPERVASELRWTNFLLAYQGYDDCAAQRRYGDLVHGLLEPRERRPPAPASRDAPGGRTRVAFVCAFFRDGTMGRYFERWVTDLPRERFDVHLYALDARCDALTERLRARTERFDEVARARPAELASALRSAHYDVIVYPEVGMDATTFVLAGQRLAPVQCAGWGHPVTTGLPTIDTYFTSGEMEPAGAQAHYRERLFPLPGLGTRYAAPADPGIDSAAARAACGLPAAAPLLLCGASLFKIHPDNDALFAQVLAALPGAHLVLFEGRHPALTAAYLRRLDQACAAAGVPAATQRVRVLPQCEHARFLQVNRACDVMLDTLHWSGGNTSLDALACGLPIVTLPGRFMRGRQSAAMLRAVGLEDLVVDAPGAYVQRVAELVDDRGARDRFRRRIESARGALFDDARPVQAFADALEALVTA